MTSEAFLSIQGLSKTYPGTGAGAAAPVFEDVSFGIERGEFVCIIGHSGCGKTTILNILAGLEEASSGFVFMDRREVRGPSLDRGGAAEHRLCRQVALARLEPSPDR